MWWGDVGWSGVGRGEVGWTVAGVGPMIWGLGRLFGALGDAKEYLGLWG